MVKKLTEWNPIGGRPKGRPKRRWTEHVLEDLGIMKIKNSKQKAMNREAWNKLVEKAKPTPGCKATGRRRRRRRRSTSEASVNSRLQGATTQKTAIFN
jgi:hypothetical protein